MKLGQAIYEKEQAAAASPDADAGAKKDDDVVDAEFSEVDENKRQGLTEMRGVWFTSN
jgi:molecular chaperone DnaK